MTPRQSPWLEGRVEVLLAALAELGMSISRAAGAELIDERVQWISSHMHITPTSARRYLTDDTLASLARTIVVEFADETPGADVLHAPRTAALPLSTLGRAVAGLAEAIQVRLRERDDVEHLRETVGQLANALSALGQLTAEHATVDDRVGSDCTAGTQAAGQLRDAVRDTVRDAVVMIPPGLLNRTARYLEACARLVRDEGILPENVNPAHADQLADAFATDAAGVRYYAGE